MWSLFKKADTQLEELSKLSLGKLTDANEEVL